MKKIIFLLMFLVVFTTFNGCSYKDSTVKEVSTPHVAPDEEKIEEYISIVTLGDNLLHMPVVRSGLRDDGTYDYSHL